MGPELTGCEGGSSSAAVVVFEVEVEAGVSAGHTTSGCDRLGDVWAADAILPCSPSSAEITGGRLGSPEACPIATGGLMGPWGQE